MSFKTKSLYISRSIIHYALCATILLLTAGSHHANAQLAQGKEKWLGNIYAQSQLERFTQYWNQVTPENAGKWQSVEFTRDQMNWTELDAAYDLAKENGFPFRFHVLVWGAQQPDWINDLSTEEQLAEIEEWFDAVAERYPDIEYLEVVNEPLHQRPDGETGEADYWEALGARGETGWDWVIKAFEMARERFPDSTKLMINDYGILGNSAAVRNYTNLIDLLKERGLIDVIGVQGHAFTVNNMSASRITSSLDDLGETGLPIQVTELDIDGNPDGTEDESDELQLSRYQRIFPALWEHPKLEGITLWGWMPGQWRSSQEAYIFERRPRPALEWLEEYVDTAQVFVNVSNEPEDGNNIPEGFELSQNYPNPFNPTTNIGFTLPQAAQVELKVYDMVGREVATLVDERMPAGTKTLQFDASNLPSGMYIYRIRANEFTSTKKMVLIK